MWGEVRKALEDGWLLPVLLERLIVSTDNIAMFAVKILFAWGAYRTSPMIQDRMMSVL